MDAKLPLPELAPPRGSDRLGPRTSRQRELARLATCFDQARATGRGQVALVTGAAGMGGEVLLDALAQRLEGNGALVLEGRCTGGGAPYQPFLEILEAAAPRLLEAGHPNLVARATQVATALRGCEPRPTDRQRPWELRRTSLFDAFAQLIEDCADALPLALILHDLDHGDAATRALLAHLAQTRFGAVELEGSGRPGLAALLVVSCREPAPAWLDGVQVERLALGPLDTDGVRAFLQSPAVVSFFAEASGGDPQRLEALLGEAASTPSDELGTARLGALGSGARRLAEALAVLGGSVGLDRLRIVAAIEADSVAQATGELLDSRLVGRRVVDGELRFFFPRASDQEACYHQLASPARQALHAAAARALAEPGETDSLAVAEHLLRAAGGESAVDAALRAADRLEAGFGYHRAFDLCRRAYEMTAREALRAPLEHRLCELARRMGDYDAALVWAERSRRRRPDWRAHRAEVEVLLLRDEHERAIEALARAESSAGPESHRGLCALRAEALLLGGKLLEARSACLAALQAPGAIDPTERSAELQARNTLGKVLLQQGAYAEASELFAVNVAAARAVDDGFEACRAMYNLGITLFARGDHDGAADRYRTALALAETQGDHRNRAYCLQNLGVLAHARGDYRGALQHFHQAVGAFKRIGQRGRLAWLAVDLASVYLDLGDGSRAADLLALATRFSEGSFPAPVDLDREILAARLRAHHHDLGGAAALLARAARSARSSGVEDRALEAELRIAQVELARGRLAACAQALDQVPADCPPRPRGRALLLRGQLLLADGSAAAARSALTTAATLYRRVGDLEGLWRTQLGLLEVARALGDRREAERRHRAAGALKDRLVAQLPEPYCQTFLDAADACLEVSAQPGELTASPTSTAMPDPGTLAQAGSRYPLIVGQHPRMAQLYALLDKLAPHDSLVLIRGESGTGKELIAEALHAHSPRHGRAFIKVNCAALVESLLFSELFGHERGAFTGAVQRKKGRFELAEGGTIFLDEIGDISPKTQVALLRVLQERVIDRVGGTSSIPVNVRILCATHRNLEEMVRSGEFREDLYYRLKGIQVELPALRDRLDDLPLLVASILARVAAERGAPPKRLDAAALALLRSHRWPGNVRELENVLRTVSLLSDEMEIQARDFREYAEVFRARSDAAELQLVAPPVGTDPQSTLDAWAMLNEEGLSLKQLKARIELECITAALRATEGNITRAAARLGMKRPRLSQLIKEHGLSLALDARKEA